MQYPLIYEHNSVRVFKINDSVYYREGNLDERRQVQRRLCCAQGLYRSHRRTQRGRRTRDAGRERKAVWSPDKARVYHPCPPDHDLGLPVFAEKEG